MFAGTPPADRPTPGGTADTREDLLSDPHCKHLLAFLRETDGRATVAAAARHIVGKMTDAPAEEVPDNVRRRVQTWLHHGQLPALDARGLVDFDPERRTVALAEHAVVQSGGADDSLGREWANPDAT